MGKQLHILFVCTGNICRSPTAERLAAAYARRADILDLVSSSAGTRAVIEHPIHPYAAEVLKKLGGDPADFAARQLTAKIASGADLILTMTRDQRDAVLELAPQRLRSTFTLGEAARIASQSGVESISELARFRSQFGSYELTDVADPIGQNKQFFESVGSQIADLLTPILQLLR